MTLTGLTAAVHRHLANHQLAQAWVRFLKGQPPISGWDVLAHAVEPQPDRDEEQSVNGIEERKRAPCPLSKSSRLDVATRA